MDILYSLWDDKRGRKISSPYQKPALNLICELQAISDDNIFAKGSQRDAAAV